MFVSQQQQLEASREKSILVFQYFLKLKEKDTSTIAS
jgi:hypothetical protein